MAAASDKKNPKGPNHAHEILGLIESLRLGPTPDNYQLFHGYVSGLKPKLTAEMRPLLNAGKLDQATCNTLHAKHFECADLTSKVLDAGGKISKEMTSIMRMLAAAESSAAEYGKTLSGATNILAEEGDAKSLKAMVDTLLKATVKMRDHSQKLETRLNETTQEVSSLRNNLEQVRAEAMTDALTGVANRKRFDECMLRYCQEAENSSEPLSLVFCDIDLFKRFNDTWGHQTGDQIIRFVASCLQRNTEDHHLVARYGGEEFAVIMPATELQDAFDQADNVRAIVESKKLLRKSTNEDLGTVTISMGVSHFSSGDQVEDLIERADQALYQSKNSGRNKVTLAKEAKTSRNAA